MLRNIILVSIVVFSSFLSSCTNSGSKVEALRERLTEHIEIDERNIKVGNSVISDTLETIRIPKDIQDAVIPLGSVIDKVRYVKLQTDTNCLIGQIDKIYFLDNRIIIVDKTKAQSVFIFDGNGSFISKIYRRGRGPGEFVTIRDVCVKDDNTIVLYDDRQDRCLFFSDAGHLVKSERIGFFFIQFEYLGRDQFIHFQRTGVNQHLPSVENVDILVTKNCKNIVSAYRYHYTQFPNILKFSSRNELSHSNNENYFTPLFSDTVFEVNQDRTELEARYAIQFDGEDHLSNSLKSTANLGDYFAFINNNEMVAFNGKILSANGITFVEGYKGGAFQGPWGGFYARESRRFIGGRSFNLQGCSDIEYFYFPIAVAGNEFVSVIEPASVISWERAKSAASGGRPPATRSPKVSGWINSISDIDNPILMFYTIKNF